MQSNSDFRSRLPLPKSVFRSKMVDPRGTSRGTSVFADPLLKTTNARMSSTCIKSSYRQMTTTSAAIRTAVRLGSHPYLSSAIRPTLRNAIKSGLEVNVGAKQLVTRLDFDTNRNSLMSSPNGSSSTVNTDLNISINSKLSVKSPAKSSVKSPSIDWNAISKEAEVMSLKTNISRLEVLLEESKTKSSQKSVEYELKIESLKKDVENEKIKSKESENQIKSMERKSDDLSLQLNNAREEFGKEYQKYEKRINELNRTNVDIRTQLSDSRSAVTSTEAHHRSQQLELEDRIQSLEAKISRSQSEREVLDKQIQRLVTENKEKERLEIELTAVRTDVRLLSEELQSYRDGAKISSILENEMQELRQLREQNRELKQMNEILSDVNSKNLILEEKIFSLESQLKNANQTIRQTVVNDIESTELRKRLEEWEKALASDSPARVSAHLSELQTNELVLKSELGELRTKLNGLQSEKIRFENAFNSNKRKIEEQNDLIKKLNRKCLLFAKEKDSYKRLITSYEQDVTIDWNKVNAERVSTLESTVEEYRSLVEQLETETKQLRSEHRVEDYKKQITQLEDDLRQYKELNAKLESMYSRNIETHSPQSEGFRIIHFKQNPVSLEYETQRIELKRILEENQRLNARLQLLESGCDADITRQLDEGIKSKQQTERLEQKLKSAEKQNQNIIDAFKRSAKEFREVCWRLTGFRIDLLKNKTYRLSNIYSDSPEDYLIFELESNSQTIKLLENHFTRSLSDSINIYLTEHDSYPAFLASLTLNLFNKQTIFQTNR